VDKANSTRSMRELPGHRALSSPEFLGRLRLRSGKQRGVDLWSQQRDPSLLRDVPLSAIVDIGSLDFKAANSIDDWDTVRRKIRDITGRLVILYETCARSIADLLWSEWRLRRDIEDFNGAPRQRERWITVLGKNDVPFYAPAIVVSLPAVSSSQMIWPLDSTGAMR